MSSWDKPRRRLDGELLLPGEPGYDRHRRPQVAWFAGAHPAAVARCRHAADVAEVLRFDPAQLFG